MADYPRPQLRREQWLSLNGAWKFIYDDAGVLTQPRDIGHWDRTIEVPFAPESARSGVHEQGFHPRCWYERTFEYPRPEGRVLLHFGAVDYSARVWVDGQFVGSHRGGHTPFRFDITSSIATPGPHTVTVLAEDDPADLAKPRGKQDWQLEPHSIWYPRTTGIWQTVWLEEVPETYIDRIRWTPILERWEIGCEAFLGGRPTTGLTFHVRLQSGEQLLANDSYEVIAGEIHRRIALSDPGIDDFRNQLLWSPEKPTLLHATLELRRNGEIVDTARSYTALRSAAIQHDRFMLNGRPYYPRLVLDQGYWPDTLMTAPDSEALRRDVELVKALGFNGVRKHQKIEDPRFLYWADTLGLLVWEEMPSAYRFTHESVERLTAEWIEVIDRDYNHPCIVTWVPFNESWGVPDLSDKATHQDCVQALYHLTKTLDPTRPVIGNDGWENIATDIIGIHDYDNNPRSVYDRYGPKADLAVLLGRRRPGGRLITLESHPPRGQPVMLTEFGGIAYTRGDGFKDPKAWGYAVSQDANDLERRYVALLKVIHKLEFFSGFCYTQFTDTFQEANGLLYADRTPKVPLAILSASTGGAAFCEGEQLAHDPHDPMEAYPPREEAP